MQELELRYFDDSVVVAEIEGTCTNNLCGLDPNCPIKKFITQCQKAIDSGHGNDANYFEIADKAELKENGIIVGLNGTLGIAYKCPGSHNEKGKLLEYANGRVNIVRKPFLEEV